MKKAVVFDMDECIGSFWSLWTLYDLYSRSIINDVVKLQILAGKTILPTCCRPNLEYLLKFLHILKEGKKITQVFLYTNNGNYQTVLEKTPDKISFPNFIIGAIEKMYKIPGLFDLAFETVFIRKTDAKNHIKRKFIDDLKVHGYTQKNQILIFDDKRDVWKTGETRVIKVKEFIGCSHFFQNKNNISNLAKTLFNMLSKSEKDKYKNSQFIIKLLKDNIMEEDAKDRVPTNLKDQDVINLIIPEIMKFCLK